MIFKFEFEDEKGILQSSPYSQDAIACRIADIIKSNLCNPEGIYLTRRSEGYVYDGTAFTKDHILYLQAIDNRLFCLMESERGSFRKGKQISTCPRARQFSLG